MGHEACGLNSHERILACLDGSKFSEAAFSQAIHLARTCNSKLFLITVVDINPELLAYAPAYEEKMEKDATATLENAEKKARSEGVIEVMTVIDKEEQPYKAIVDLAKEKDISLIVMGTHGRTALGRLVMGSVAQRVIAHAPCPVLVVPGRS